MPQGYLSLTPLDNSPDGRPYVFDFQPLLSAGETIQSVSIVASISPRSEWPGQNPQSIVIGPPTVIPSDDGLMPACQVLQRFGNGDGKSLYLVRANAITNLNNTPSVWQELGSVTPA